MEVAASELQEKKSWSGFWSGLIWYAVGYFCIIATQLVAIIALMIIEVVQSGSELSEARIQESFLDGDALSISFIIFLPLILGILSFVVKIRRRQPLFSYLGFKVVSKAVLAKWVSTAVALLIIAYICGLIFNRPPFPEWIIKAYASTDIVWLFLLTITVLGPVAEELLYRGYIIKVWANSIVGPIFGTLLLSVLWAVTHLQYDFYDMAWIVILGIVLCMSRLSTKSIYPAMIIHIGWNAVSTLALVSQNSA